MTILAHYERKVRVFGGDQWRPNVHVQDAARGLIACLEGPEDRVRGEVFNIGSNDQNYRIREIGDLTDASTVEHCFREGRIRYRRAPPEYWVQYLMRLIVLEPGGDSISDALGMDLMDAEFSGVLFPSVRALGNDLKQQFGIRQNTDDEGRIGLVSNANIMDLHWQLEEQMKRERNLVAFSGSNVTRAIAHYSWEDADGGRGEEANPYYEVSAEQLESVRLTERDRLGLDPRAAADAGLIPDAWMRAEFPCNVMWVRDE